MNVVADESVEKSVVIYLRKFFNSVYYITEECSGTSDIEVLSKCHSLSAILVTADKDFGTLVIKERIEVRGALLLRFTSSDKLKKLSALNEFLFNYKQMLDGNFTVLDEENIRVRKLHKDSK
jgi:predicted nuclease of predicted toxin-antitoxin system